MPIRKDQSKLPKAAPKRDDGPPPDRWKVRPEDSLIIPLVEAWLSKVREDEREFAFEGATQRASWSSRRCSRQLAYTLAGTPESNPPDIAAQWRMEQGTAVHNTLQEFALEVSAFLRCELKRAVSDEMGVTIDFWFEDMQETLELKTDGGFKFKMRTLPFKGGPSGANFDHIVQAALAGKATNARAIRVAYVSMENISRDLQKRYGLTPPELFSAEYRLTRDEYLPLADAEIERQNMIADIVRIQGGADAVSRLLHDPEVDDFPVRISDPSRGTWVRVDGSGAVTNSGTTWRCNYCSYQDECVRSLAQPAQSPIREYKDIAASIDEAAKADYPTMMAEAHKRDYREIYEEDPVYGQGRQD